MKGLARTSLASQWRILTLLVVGVLMTSGLTFVASASRVDVADRPVVLVHGYDVTGRSVDCAVSWQATREGLRQWGRTNVVTIGFSINDRNCDVELGRFDTNTSFAVIGQRLNAYLATLGSFDLVGYSAGGLIVNDAVAKGALGAYGYQKVSASSLVTIGSPLDGAGLAQLCVWDYQCEEMRQGSRYLVDLQAAMASYDANPDRAVRTRIASVADGVVDPLSALWGTAEYTVLYPSFRHDQLSGQEALVGGPGRVTRGTQVLYLDALPTLPDAVGEVVTIG